MYVQVPMPELPDIALYLHALEARVVGRPLERVRLASPFLVRTVDPPLTSLHGEVVRRLRRIGKRIVFEFDGPRFLVLHLMIAGRLRWKSAGAALTGRMSLAAFDFPDGTLILTEAGSKKRASLHVVAGEQALDDHDPGGLEVLGVSTAAFAARLVDERRTLKRALTDPRVFSGIGNAYSDEILHAARLLPFRKRSTLASEEVDALYEATRSTLSTAIDVLRERVPPTFEKQARDWLAVHDKGGQPCPRCGARITQVKAGGFITSYCRGCQR